MVDELTEAQASEAMWTRHACDGCRKDVEMDGVVHSVQAATVDGLTSTRHAKCKVHGCKLDLPGLRGDRSVVARRYQRT